MHKHIMLFLVLGLAAGSASAAGQRAKYEAPASTEETTGFFSGILLGGLAGGPPGAIIGGALGAFAGDGWHAKSQVDDLQAELYTAQLEVAMMREQTHILQQEYQLARKQLDGLRSDKARIQLAGLNQAASAPCCDNMTLSLHFRSGSAAIEAQYQEQLASLVKLVKQLPSASVEITGYADRNGDADRNLSLSRERSESVKLFLQQLGISNASLTTIAYGETRPVQAEQNLETDFFDRRVIVRIRDTSQQLLTQTPDGN